MRGTKLIKTSQRGVYRVDGKKDHFEIHISVKDAINGKYGKKTPRFHGSFKDACEKQAELKKELKDAPNAGSKGWTMAELATTYFKHMDNKKQVGTLRSDKGRWKIMEPGLGSLRVRSVTELTVDTYLDELHRARGIKKATVFQYRSLLSAMFRQAKKWGVATRNPVLESTQYKADQVERTYVNANHYFMLVKHLRAVDEDPMATLMADVMDLSLRLGSRRSETLALRVGDFDRERQTITICRAVKEPEGGGYIIGDNKSHNIRTFAVDDEEAFLLEQRIAALSQATEGIARLPTPHLYLFSANGGVDPIRPGVVTKRVERLKKSCCSNCGVVWMKKGVKAKVDCPDCKINLGVDIVLKYARRLTTTTLLRAGVNPAYVQYRGGWKDPKVMLTNYADFHTDDAVGAHAAIASLFGDQAGREVS